MSKKDTVEVTRGFLEYQRAELTKLQERLRGMRAKLKEAERSQMELRDKLCREEHENATLRAMLDRAKAHDRMWSAEKEAVWPAEQCVSAYNGIKRMYAASRERDMALTKLDECELWLLRCNIADTAAPTLKGAASPADAPTLQPVLRMAVE